MNHSHFIKIMGRDHSVNFNDVWKKSLYSKDEYSTKRALSDDIETEFWASYSKKYDNVPSLYDYAPYTFDKLLSIVGENKTLIEFGCGTGKFTIPMAGKSNKIIAVDFSNHMLSQLSEKLASQDIDNVELVNNKFEDFHVSDKVDSLYCVNANYRIIDMENALKKMNNIVKENVVMVWTMQRSIYDHILNRTENKGIERRQEYIHIINLLYQMGIDPNLEILDVNKPMEIYDVEENYKEIRMICEKYDLPYGFIKEEFDHCTYAEDDKLIYNCKLKVAYIHFKPYFSF